MTNTECPICLDDIEKFDYYKLPCNHLICKACFKEFRKIYSTCCFCRRPFSIYYVEFIRFRPFNYGKSWHSVQEFLLIDMYLNSVSISDISELLEKTERSILNKLGRLKKTELYKLDILRQERLRNFIKKEEEERLRNFNMIIESHSGDDDDNNKFKKKMKIIVTGISISSILVISFCVSKYLIK
ncbi:uncharacterized protein METZ01_LOCUS315908 [marine metagenome]|uniref:RING-type domain-containing protein n=1 Tax=marine metagenome TaxID=408172 RepID=A0A382NPE8_9ZZZZ